MKQHYHNIAATHHPDKTKDEAKIVLYETKKETYDRISAAYKMLGSANDEGHFEE